MRLIDADAVLTHAIPVFGVYDDTCDFDAVAVGYIKGAPTIDAVPVVRCGECIWRDTEKRGYGDECVCKRWSEVGLVDHYTAPADFCSYGEKREEDQP